MASRILRWLRIRRLGPAHELTRDEDLKPRAFFGALVFFFGRLGARGGTLAWHSPAPRHIHTTQNEPRPQALHSQGLDQEGVVVCDVLDAL